MIKVNSNELIKWLLLFAAITSEVTAALLLKGALSNSLLYAGVFAGYITSFTLLSFVLQKGMPLEWPMASGEPQVWR